MTWNASGCRSNQRPASCADRAPSADSTNRKQVEAAIDGYRKQAIKFQEQLAQQQEQGGQEAGEQQLNNPFGDLGGGAAPVTPTP